MAQDNAARTPFAFFRDRAVLVTGASSGIGYDVALSFAQRGAQVALLARRRSKLQELASRISALGGQALVLPCDVTRRSDLNAAVEQACRAYGQIDVLVNSAGVLVPNRVEEMRTEDLERMIDVNLVGTVNAIQAVLPRMREAGSGSIVNIASLAGRRGISPLGGYSATKFAVVGLTEALRIELFGSGITVSLVMPGVIDTPMEEGAWSSPALRSFPKMFAMPPRWVTWAVMAAVALRLNEVDVPPGAAVAEKLAALFPGVSDAFISVGTRILERIGRYRERAAEQSAANGGGEEAPPKAASAGKSREEAAS